MGAKRKPIPKKLRLQVYEKYGGRCAYCGNPIKYEDMQVDHLEPLKGDLSTSETMGRRTSKFVKRAF